MGVRPDTGVVFDADTYVRGMAHDAFARLREREPVTWMEETALGPWPAGPLPEPPSPGHWGAQRGQAAPGGVPGPR